QEKILVVDDEKEIAELIRDYLRAEGFEVFLAFDGEEAVNCFREHKPQLVVLDIMLPKMDGTEVCRVIRGESNIPILMVSAKKSDVDKILALGLGADDYMTKPFSPGEMVARVKAQLRRFTRLSAPLEEKEKLLYGDLEIDLRGYAVTLAGKSILLSAKEFELLRYLAQNPNQVLTREQIFDQVWSFNDYGDINTVTVHIRRIREKMAPDPSKPVFIKTVWGVGYKFTGGKS
ncbi:MAG: response regulator transcription factor, partial [Candidatus Contubernalis sp.]|nr:response regulator transcription factor [Candidatus Contubernalis sp.]